MDWNESINLFRSRGGNKEQGNKEGRYFFDLGWGTNALDNLK